MRDLLSAQGRAVLPVFPQHCSLLQFLGQAGSHCCVWVKSLLCLLCRFTRLTLLVPFFTPMFCECHVTRMSMGQGDVRCAGNAGVGCLSQIPGKKKWLGDVQVDFLLTQRARSRFTVYFPYTLLQNRHCLGNVPFNTSVIGITPDSVCD